MSILSVFVYVSCSVPTFLASGSGASYELPNRLNANVDPPCDLSLSLMFVSHFHCGDVCSEINLFVLEKD